MKKLLLCLIIISFTTVLATSCEKSLPILGVEASASNSSVFFNIEHIEIAEGLAHEPNGRNQLYGTKEAPIIWWSRSPQIPINSEDIIITAALWRDDCPNIYVE